jgi:hypothetical protein
VSAVSEGDDDEFSIATAAGEDADEKELSEDAGTEAAAAAGLEVQHASELVADGQTGTAVADNACADAASDELPAAGAVPANPATAAVPAAANSSVPEFNSKQRGEAAELYETFLATGKLQSGPQRWKFGGQLPGSVGGDVEVAVHANTAHQLGEANVLSM